MSFLKGEIVAEELIYVYCLTNKIPKLKEAEDLVGNVYFSYYRGLYAVVSKVRKSEFGKENLKKNLADFKWVKDKATVHEKVIEAIMKNSCVIPFKFATIFNNEDNLKAMLEEHLKDFKAILKRLEDKEEWGVKIYCDLEKLKEALLKEDGELLNLDKEISSSPPGKAFILKKKKEELLNTVMNKKLNEYGQYSFERLSQSGRDARINKLLPKEVTERKDEMILNSAFLIDKNKVADFLNTVERLKTKYADKGLFFDCTGPWPPYNFCSVDKKEAVKK